MNDFVSSAPATRGVIVVGDSPFVSAHDVSHLAMTLGWPVLAEPTAAPWLLPNFIAHAPLVVERLPAMTTAEVETILAIGRVGLSRPINALLQTSKAKKYWAKPPALLTKSGQFLLLDDLPKLTPDAAKSGDDWLKRWQEAANQIELVIETHLSDSPLSGVEVARSLVAALHPNDVVHFGSSYPARDVELYAAQSSAWASGPLTVYMNRGVNGIDGVVSTAMGESLASGRPTYLLCGDLTLLHDLNGLIFSDREPRGDLTLVVVDNDGGGIFSTLENVDEPGFERVMATPLGKDLVAILQAIGLPTEVATTKGELQRALEHRTTGLRAIVARVMNRADEARLRTRIREAVVDK